jgi:predicted amidohydrolase
MHEADFLAPGNKLVTIDLPWGRAGLAVCYDLRFPEMFRSYALEGAQLILLSAEWPKPRLEHWRTLLRARAIENQTFVVACNCVGEGGGNVFFGHSMVVDPWGEVIVEGQEHEEVLVAKLDLTRVVEIRRQYPVFADRRAGLYSLP